MSNIMMVTSGKGGTGKTTVALLLAKALCRHGKNVLLLELDSGLRGMDILLGVSDKVVYDLSDVLLGRCKPAKAITVCDCENGNLHLIAAPVNRRFVPDKDKLAELLQGLGGCYDYLLLDCAAGLGKSFDCARAVCGGALVVCTADSVSVRDASIAVQSLDGVNARLVINKFSRRLLNDSIPDLDAVIDAAGAQLISVIPEDNAVYRLSTLHGNLNADSNAFLEIEDLARRILGEKIRLNVGRLK